MKNSLNAILCFCLLCVLCISPGRAQGPEGTPDPQTPPAQPATAQPAAAQPAAAQGPVGTPAPQPPDETPAPQPRTSIIQTPPPIPKYPDVQMPGETGYYAGLIGWMPLGAPIVNKGQQADFSGASYFHLPGTPSLTPSGEIGVAIGLHNSLDLSYYYTKARGTVYAPGPLVLFNQSYNQGDYLATSDKVHDLKLSFAYLSWPYPVESRHVRLRTLFQMHYFTISSNYDAPIRSATPNSSGALASYATTGGKNIYSPTLGLGLAEYASRQFRLELNVAGFDVPHHWALADADLSANYRVVGRFEVRLGAKGLYYKTSPQADFFFRGRLLGAFVGVRWCSD